MRYIEVKQKLIKASEKKMVISPRGHTSRNYFEDSDISEAPSVNIE